MVRRKLIDIICQRNYSAQLQVVMYSSGGRGILSAIHLLAVITRHILRVPTTSVLDERVSSIAGLTITHQRLA